jgi:TPR repeat protein/tRNA A-37 threonylcarbamoyl transferase component Bud32
MSVSLAIGGLFARDYRILQPLAEGGMGAVYVVEQLSTGSRRALKLMHPQLVQDPRLRQRFEQEARVGARIESDHVVQVLAAGVDDETGFPYLVMELLKGEDLAEALARVGAMSPADVGHIFAQLCHALAAAHAAGVVHRDLKPENVFLATSHREGATLTVKVLDFGIAKVLAEAKTTFTAAIGTPMWMAPEQTTPNAGIGPQADVWALGLIAFRMLTGRIYWVAGNAEGANTASLMREILLEPVIPASARAAQLGVGHLLPPGFDAWFARCVNREVGPRFATAAEVRAALGPLLGAPPSGPQALVTPAPGLTQPQGPMTPLPGATQQQAPTQQAPQQARTVLGAPVFAGQAPPTRTPPGASFTPPGAHPVAQPPTRPRGTSFAPFAVGGALLVALVGFGAVKVGGARAQRTCEKDAPTAVAADAAATAAACKRACASKGGEACVTQGELVERFKIGDDHAEVARSAFDKACDGGDGRGCRRAAALAEHTDAALAVELYTKACDKGDAPGCTALGALRELGGGGVERDRMRALALYDKACTDGDALGCAYKSFMLGAGRGIKQDEAKAAELATGALAGVGAACEAGDPRACVALGALLDRTDQARAAQVEQQACDAGEPAGCASLGVRTLLGAGIFKDGKRGAALLKQGCDGGEPAACTGLGLLAAKAAFTVRRGVRGVPVLKLACEGVYNVGCAGWGATLDAPADLGLEPAAAVSLSAKACEAGELIGCVNLGAFHQFAVGTARNREKASELFKKACDAGDAGGCGELGAMHATGRGVPFDGKRAMALLGQACEWGERDSCATAGDLQVNGSGVPKAPEEGAAVFKTYCEKYNLAMACSAYAGVLAQGRGVKKDGPAAVALLKLVCDGKKDRPYASGCVNLGNLYEGGVGVPKDLAAAAKYYQLACDHGGLGGCTGMARLHADGLGVPRDAVKARALVESGCKAGDAGSCDQLGYFHAVGKAGLAPDGVEGIRYFQLACDDASWGSCTNIGVLYLLGIAKTPRDRAKAAEYLKLACSHGEEGACQKVKENAL